MKVQKHNWGLIVAVVVIAGLWAIPTVHIQDFVTDSKEKITLLESLVIYLTTLVKSTTTLVVALAALLFYRWSRP